MNFYLSVTYNTIEMFSYLHSFDITDPRLSDELEHDLLELLLKLLQHEQNPKLQSHVAIILQLVVAYSSNWKLVIDNITHSTIVNLLHSELSAVRVQVTIKQ